MTLAATQRRLADALQSPSPLNGDPAAVAAAEGIARGNERLSSVEQVDIYREQFWLRHVDVLRDDFGSLEHALGEEGFEALTRAYLAACPSTSFSLRDLGEHMLRFVAGTEPWSKDPFLADLARVEWAFVDAFDAPDAPLFDPKVLAGVDEEAWPRAVIGFEPALQRLSLSYPAHDYRIAVKKGEEAVRPEARRCHVVIYRGPDLLHCLEIEPDAAAMLAELAAGKALGEACERAAAASGGELEAFQAKLGGWFSEWTAIGWIRSLTFPL